MPTSDSLMSLTNRPKLAGNEREAARQPVFRVSAMPRYDYGDCPGCHSELVRDGDLAVCKNVDCSESTGGGGWPIYDR